VRKRRHAIRFEVHVAVPETGHNHFARAIDLFCRFWNVDLAAGTYLGDFSIPNQDYGILDGLRGRRGKNLSALQCEFAVIGSGRSRAD
jgi:hypothetical protein